MTKETTTKDPKVESMLKALGYIDDIAEQAKLPAEREDAQETVTTEETAETQTEESAAASTETAETEATETPAEEVVADEAAPAEEKKVEPAKQEPVKEEPRVKKVTPKIPSLDEIRDVVKEEVAAKLPKKEEPKTEVHDTFRKNLHPAELKSLELAEAAEKLLGDKYKGQAAKEAEWITAHRRFVQEYVKENGSFDANDESYKDFVKKNRPVIDRDEVFVAQAEDRAVARAKKELEAEIAKRDRSLAELRFAPVIEKTEAAIKDDILGIVGEDFAKAYNAAPDKLEEEFPIEAPIVVRGLAATASAAKEYISIAKGLKQFDESNQTHEHLLNFVETQGRHLDDAAEAGTPQVRDGKTIISRERYAKLREAGKDVSRLTTLTDDDVVKMLAYAGKEGIKSQLAAEKKRYEAQAAALARRTQKTTPPSEEKKVEVKTATTPPKGGVTPAKGAKTNTSTKSTPDALKFLGYEGVNPTKD